MPEQILYQDRLIELRTATIIFKDYYFPSMKPKEVLLENIKMIETKKPTMATGKYRYHGTGDFRTWYPMDMDRSKRDTIFIMSLKTQRVRIGFTVENSEAVKKIFQEKGLLQREQ